MHLQNDEDIYYGILGYILIGKFLAMDRCWKNREIDNIKVKKSIF